MSAATQLGLDALPEWRVRTGIRPVPAHQRGTFRLPWRASSAEHDYAAGDRAPAWVCCRCGGVEFNQHLLALNHACCFDDSIRLHKAAPDGCRRMESTNRLMRLGTIRAPQVGVYDASWEPS